MLSRNRAFAGLAALASLLTAAPLLAKPRQSIPPLLGVSSPPSPSSVAIDPNGNTTSKSKAGVTTTFHYDIRDQLGEAELPPESTLRNHITRWRQQHFAAIR